MTNELSKKVDQSQTLTDKQRKILAIIFAQLQTHDRTTTFTLGSTIRTHTFGPNETWVATAKWAEIFSVTTMSVMRWLKQLTAIDMIILTRVTNWSRVGLTDVALKCCTDIEKNVGLNVVLNVGLDVGLETPKKHGSNENVGLKCWTEPDSTFFPLGKDGTEKSSKTNSRLQSNTAQYPVKSSRTNKLFESKELPEERRTKALRNLNTFAASSLLSNPAFAKFHMKELVQFNNQLAMLDDGILGSRPRRDRIAKNRYSDWRNMCMKNSKRSCLFEFFIHEQNEIIDAIKSSKAIHGSDWFTFEWLLAFPYDPNTKSKNVNGSPNLSKLLEGKYTIVSDYIREQRKKESLFAVKPASKRKAKITTEADQAWLDSLNKF